MKDTTIKWFGGLLAVIAIGLSPAIAARGKAKTEPEAPLTAAGQQLERRCAAALASLREEINQSLPVLAEQKKSALVKARDAAKAAQTKADSAQESSVKTKNLQAKIDNWKKFWIGKADKGIAKAQADLNAATTNAQRDAAKKEIVKWQANKADGEKAIKQAQAELEQAKTGQPALTQANQSAQAASAQARTNELNAAKALLADANPFLSNDKMDAKLVKCAVLAAATPRGLAAFAQESPQHEALVEKLLADDKLMKEMLIAGGASYGKYGRAMEIFTAIQKASAKAGEGALHRLALATSLELAAPVKQNNAQDQTAAPVFVDPVKRYLHYEQAYLAGELDPAFKTLSVWELRMVVDCDAPDEILAWGRAMLRNYRPDHIYDANYGWRYSATVRTEVRYGSEEGKNDLPSLNSYQNIIKDGGVCGRRAFFGRFILRSFGIPVWGVTQHKHAALSHWTPKGWVVNLGAGFPHSWWDKDEVSRSGSDFLLETQAREHPQDYVKVLRAQWVSRILGEPAYNDRKKVAGGIWSSLAHYQTLMLAATAVELGPLGQELAEANEPQELNKHEQAPVTEADTKVTVAGNGVITIPAVAHGKSTGPCTSMKSYSGGMQIHCGGGFKTQYVFEAPQAGRFALTARVVTVHEGQKFLFAANGAQQPVEVAVPYTIGLWQQTKPVVIPLNKGQNVLQFAVKDGSRGVSLKDFTLTAVN
jgi:chemotaxis protein histidine kinase CheA